MPDNVSLNSNLIYKPSQKKQLRTGGGVGPLVYQIVIVFHSLKLVAGESTLALS